VAKTGETMYDQRLFNQEGGMASGLATDDTYNLYDKTLWADRGNNLYKPRNPEEDGGEADGTVRQFRPDKVHPPPPPRPRCAEHVCHHWLLGALQLLVVRTWHAWCGERGGVSAVLAT